MSDIFREVEEDLRRERLKKVWDRFGIYIILVAVLIVALTAGWRGYEAWQTARERAAGDAFAAALEEAEATGTVSSAKALLAFADEAPGGYDILARFRAATALDAAGEGERAAEVLRSLSAAGDVPELYQGLARLRLGHVLLGGGQPGAAREAVAPLAQNLESPFHNSARELMGLAAYSERDTDAARRWYASLAEEAGVPADVRQRAELMLALLAQTAPATTATAGETSDAAGQETN